MLSRDLFVRLNILLLVLFFGITTNGQNKDSTVVIRNVTVIDMLGDRPKSGLTVAVSGNRISAIGKNAKIPSGAQVIDGAGKFLIPGLWDMHVHIFNNVSAPGTNNKDTYFPLFVANGVTGVRDMFTDADDIKLVSEWQKEMSAGYLIAPRIITASSIIDGVPVVNANSVSVSNGEEARRAVRTFKAAGASFIKIYDNLSRESFLAIADESKKLNIPFAGHVPKSVTAVEASDAGQKSMEHLVRMLVACSSVEDKYKYLNSDEWTPAIRVEIVQSFDEKKCRQVGAVFARNGTWHDPTNVVSRVGLSDDESLKKDERLKYIARGEAQYWLKFSERFNPRTRKNRELWFQRHLQITKALHDANVSMLAGTDVGNPYIYAGFSLHDELELFVQAGLTPFEALRTATVNPAKYLGLGKSVGTIEKGKFADLILLDANPITDISNTRKINAVIINGRYLPRNVLDKMLLEAETGPENK